MFHDFIKIELKKIEFNNFEFIRLTKMFFTR